jgi:hypothetical protein
MESYGSPLGEEKIAGLPGRRQSGFFIGSLKVGKFFMVCHIM